MTEKAKEEEEREETRSLATWRPFAELERWPWERGPGRLGRLMDDLFREWPVSRGRGLLPPVDIIENDAQYTVTVELPGTRKEDVHVELHEGMLTVRGEKKSEREETKERSRYLERS